MIANLLNVFLGLALVFVAVLRPPLFTARPLLPLAVAAGIFIVAWAARRSDYRSWQNNTNMVLAMFLAGVTGLRLEHVPLAGFWGQFFIGTVVAVLALWAALYRPAASPTSNGSIDGSAPPASGP